MIPSEQEDKRIEKGVSDRLAELAGAGVGAGLGLASTFPLDAYYQQKLTNKALQLSKEKELALKDWDVLFKLFTGQLSLEDLPESERFFFSEQLKINHDTLKQLSRSPYERMRAVTNFERGMVKPLFDGAERVKMKGSFPHKIHHPASKFLPGLAGIAGSIGAKILNDQMKSRENQ